MRTALLTVAAFAAALSAAEPAIRRDPNGVNVNASGATTVFITFGGLANQVPAEAFWCGDLVPAAPDIGQKCDPATIFGRLPLRYDRSRLSGAAFTDIMSIPPSVARRAYQAAQGGARSSFFYVRRFVSLSGGPDEYVFVTCRMAGGGARVPFSLVDVRLEFSSGERVAAVRTGERPPSFAAAITFNGTGQLKGRWEVVLPGEELPSEEDLLTEATLPPSERPLQRRYTHLERFSVFLPPTGRFVLPGPEVTKMPTGVEGLYLVLLRVEATDDKEADSNLALAGAGQGVVHSGAVAGFPMPTLRYLVGGTPAPDGGERLRLLLPADGLKVAPGQPLDFTWVDSAPGAAVRLEVESAEGQIVFAAVVRPGLGVHRAPPWLSEKLGGGPARWRVVALDRDGEPVERSAWRALSAARPADPPR